MTYQFTKDLETGNALIDREHKELFDAINNLLDACSKGQGRTQLAEVAKFLQSYINKHFSDEERLQVQSRYPEYQTHKKYHEGFKKSVDALVKKLDTQGPSIALVGEMNSALAGWLIQHIKREDKKLAAYLKERG